jgi:4-alpha-glucanotransferase
VTTDAWGIDDGWIDTGGAWHAAPTSTLEAVRAAMGAPDHGGEPGGSPVWVVRPGQDEPLLGRCRLLLEGGHDLGELDRLPPDLPLGIHDLVPADGGPTTTLIVSPRRCHLPADLHAWGVTMQVPTTRSSGSWGIGDLADVRDVARWVGAAGGGALGLSPLHAPTPTAPVQPSPYYPSSRRWRNPLLLRVDAVPGAEAVPEVAGLAGRARRLLADPVVHRDQVWALQRAALERVWAARSDADRRALDAWRSAQGAPLEGWARFCALADLHGPGWSSWPAELRRPDAAAVDRAAAEHADRVAFHAWLQQLVQRQLEAAQVPGVRLVQDLAIGVDPDGADAWLLQDLLALEMSVGAPPDDFARDGQGWGLPPFIPWRLRDVGYRPFAELLRASMASDGGLRVDHVMGLSRLFWIPAGRPPSEGTYVRFAGRELLDVLALESARAGAVVVGEDLGTVEPGFREALRETSVLSTRLVWFEDAPPEDQPREALAMVTTHDLPTIAGVVTGADAEELERLGRPAPPEAAERLRRRLDAVVGPVDGASPLEVVAAVHRRLARTPAALVLVTLEDLCLVERRPNVPGTTEVDRPNWSLVLPVAVDDLAADPTVAATVRPLVEQAKM